MRRPFLLSLAALVPLLAVLAFSLHAQAPTKPVDAADLDFFEKKIRPVLVEHCLKCHGDDPKKVRGSLDLRTRASILAGGDSGPAAVPGKPQESLLVQAVRYQDAALEMPPKGMLPKEVIADFEQWVKRGLPDPRTATATTKAPEKIDLVKAREFWAFRPLARPALPAVKNAAWPVNDVDRFILHRLEAAGLTPALDADRRTWLRRVTFDLVGLPPTPAEIDAFIADTTPAAYEKVVDRLLESPRFGERWGRHWLDVARYADSNGLDENLTFHDAWRYRDYVIAAFNADKPFNQFIVEQLAGDLLPAETNTQRREQVIATGFLVLGPKILAERDKPKLVLDVVDEQVDTVGRAFLGLTLGCARCHDHKFDPIPTADYYALAGIFKSTQTLAGFKLGNPVVSGWSLRPLVPEEQYKAYQDHLAAVKAVAADLTKANDELKKLGATVQVVEPAPLARLSGQGKLGVVVDDRDAVRVGEWKASTFHPTYVGDGYVHDNKEGKGKKSIAFVPQLPEAGEYEVRLAYTGGAGRPANVPVTVRCAEGEKKVLFDQRQLPTIEKLWAKLGRFRFEAGKQGSVTISTEGTTEAFVVADAVQFIPVALLDRKSGTDEEQQADRKAASKPVANPPASEKFLELREKVKQLEAKKAALEKNAPAPVPTAMAVAEAKVADCPIAIRGNHQSLGPVVSRGVLSVLAPAEPIKMPAAQSGRLELARWLASGDNPLVPRVIVNRLWHHLFGQGIVRTPDDFGERGDRPLHPELLDYLASRFVTNGWHMKDTIRLLCLSRAYRQSSAFNAAHARSDADNRLLWRMNRRRLQVESIRDAILAVSGQLDLTAGGSTLPHQEERAIDNQSKGASQVESKRRSVYLTVFRNDVPEMYQIFDFVDPHVLNGKRDTTTVAPQALFLMNSRFVLDRSADLARRVLAEQKDGAARVQAAYQLTLAREPTPEERERALAYLAETMDEARAWQGLCQVLFASTEFRYLD